MTTYYREFSTTEIVASRDYAARRGTLGHNVQRMRGVPSDAEQEVIRVYFSSGPLAIGGAIDVKRVRPR